MNKKKMNRLEKASYLLKSKKAQGHVEIILSFTLFIGAIIILFIFINPFAETKEISIEGDIQNKIINGMSLEIGKLSAIVSAPTNCYYFDKSSPSYVGKYQEVYEGNRKYNIYFGEIFEDSSPNWDGSCGGGEYSLGIYSSNKMVVEEKIQSTISDYNSDYNALKNSLGIANNFMFKFKDTNNNEISGLSVSKEVPVGLDVYVSEFPVRVINSSADVKELILNLQVWE